MRALLLACVLALVVAAPAGARFPAADAGYHDYFELATVVEGVAARHPSLVTGFSLGRSYQGRELWAAKISARVGADEPEPEVLLVAGMHAREHLTVEMALYLLGELTDQYGRDARVTRVLDTREIWIVFNLNPDGSEYDIEGGDYRLWRKSRQPDGGGEAVGVDLNRNWAFRWACCRGSSRDPRADDYRGTAAFSAVEAQRLRDFVASRVVGGAQQIRAAIDFHTFSELVLWPYGYTRSPLAAGLERLDRDAFVALGRQMAAANGYSAAQAAELYIADGTLQDWLWGVHGIYAYTFELYPRQTRSGGFYPPDEAITRETGRNRGPVLALLETADCVQRMAPGGESRCGLAPVTLFADDFRRGRGWTVDQQGSDTATAGRWTRAGGALVTGRRGDVDGGTTSAASPAVALTGGSRYWLRLRSRLRGHGALRVSVLGADGARASVYARRDGGWARATLNLDSFAGQTVRILVQANDGGRDSLVEVTIDDVRVTRE